MRSLSLMIIKKQLSSVIVNIATMFNQTVACLEAALSVLGRLRIINWLFRKWGSGARSGSSMKMGSLNLVADTNYSFQQNIAPGGNDIVR